MKRVIAFLGLALLLVAVPAMAGQDRENWSPSEVPTTDAPAALVPGPWDGPGVPLYDNGPLVTHPGGGSGGADASALQVSGLGMNTLGFGHQVLNNNRIADDFTVPAGPGWLITDIQFFAYQTNSTTTSTMTAVNYRIWDGDPAGGGTVIYGDTTTNRMTNTTWSNIYRATDTGLTATNRPIMVNTAAAGVFLPPGTYWLDWSTDGSLASGPWAPPITILGTAVTGNGEQSVGGGAFAPALDSGTGTPQQGFPFILYGVEGNYCNDPMVAIPDNDPVGVSDTMVIAPTGEFITDLDLVIQASHTWIGDLIFTLQHVETGTAVTAIDQPNCSGDDIDATINDEGLDGDVETVCLASVPTSVGELVGGDPPDTSLLTAFDGEGIGGSWTLTVSDNAGADTGSLDAWCLRVTTDTMPFLDGFESGDTSAWSFVVP